MVLQCRPDRVLRVVPAQGHEPHREVEARPPRHHGNDLDEAGGEGDAVLKVAEAERLGYGVVL